jgi:lipid II:glycine glycyltransferase (peptidoglycan interpeptide bridge formation enzyme)
VAAEQRELWDTFVNEHPYGHMLQCWAWGDIKADSGWQPLRLALWDQELGRIVAGAQVLRRTAPRVPLWAGHLAYIPKGPVLDWTQGGLCARFFAELATYLRRHGAIALRFEPPLVTETPEEQSLYVQLKAFPAHPIHPLQPLRTIMVDLEADEDELRRRMKEKWRYNIGLAARKGVGIRAAETAEDVRRWYELLKVTGARDQFGVHTLDYYLLAWRLLSARNSVRLLLAEHEGQLLAGIFVTLYAHEGIYMYGASSNEHRNLMPNYLLQWEAMRWAKSLGARQYDLWGIPDTDNEDEAMAGVYRFKSGWGGGVLRFVGGYEQVYRPLTMRLARRFL